MCTLKKKLNEPREFVYSKGYRVKYLLESKTNVDLVEFDSQSPFQFQKHSMLQPPERVFS